MRCNQHQSWVGCEHRSRHRQQSV